MIKFTKLGFRNVFSYADWTTVELDSAKVTQLVGDNGAGKTSIILVLEETLYNKNSRGVAKKDIVNRYTDDNSYESYVEFYVDDVQYLVRKKVTSTAKVTLLKGSEDISGHTATQTYKLIESIIGLDFTTFSKLVCQSMASSLDFLTATDTNRKKFLVDLLDCGVYYEIEAISKLKTKDLDSEIQAVSSSITTLRSMLDRVQKLPIDKRTIMEMPNIRPELQAEISDITHSISVAESVAQKVRTKKQKIKTIEEAESYLPPTAPTFDQEALATATEQVSNLEKEIFSLKAEERKIREIKTECPTCNRPFEGIPDKDAMLSEVLPKLESLARDLATKLSSVNKLKTDKSTYIRYVNSTAEIAKMKAALEEGFSDVPDSEPKVSELQERLDYLKAELKHKTDESLRIQAQNRQALEHNAAVDERVRQLQDLTERLAPLQGSLDDLKVKAARMKALTDSVGSKGIITYKIEYMIKTFEVLINEYLSQLSDGELALNFSVDGSKLACNVYQHGIESNPKSISSGELNKLNTAVLLAVRKLMQSISKVQINILFLDEVISVLDTRARNNLIEVLLTETDLNSFAVSHGFTHPLTTKLEIVKDGKFSKIKA